MKYNKKFFLGFAWILSDILCQIPSLRINVISNILINTLSSTIGRNMISYWNNIKNNLSTIMASKMVAFKCIKKIIFSINTDQKRRILGVFLFGSVAQFLCDEDSDIDVYVQEVEGKPYISILQTHVVIYFRETLSSSP